MKLHENVTKYLHMPNKTIENLNTDLREFNVCLEHLNNENTSTHFKCWHIQVMTQFTFLFRQIYAHPYISITRQGNTSTIEAIFFK
jgi:hypothetical protein